MLKKICALNSNNCGFDGVALPNHVQERLDAYVDSVLPIDFSLSKLARKLSALGNIIDLETVSYIESIAIQYLDSAQTSQNSSAITILIDCSFYYDCIGRPKKALELALIALGAAERSADASLERRAHNVAGVCYSKICDFNRACIHMEKAFNLALQIGKPLFILASLSNIVAVLDMMGLTRAARDIALKAAEQPQGDPHLDYLHLVNANNGIRISHSIGDTHSAERFYSISKEKVLSAAQVVTEVTLAYYQAARVEHEIAGGHTALALSHINEALKGQSVETNIKISTLLYCAQANTHIAIRDQKLLDQSIRKLQILLKATTELPIHHEELLRTLMKLHAARNLRKDKSLGLRYLQLLREHVIAVKHGYFFSQTQIVQPDSLSVHSLRLVNPSYKIPAWIVQIATNDNAKENDKPLILSSELLELDVLSTELAKASSNKAEQRLRTIEYSIAENWAIASEFASEGNGLHCFRVGHVAGIIALELGMTLEESSMLELACRLHDIGKSTIVFSRSERRSLRSLGQFAVIYEHTFAGERLLAASPDKTLQLASKIAKNHHEWWNGCGFPNGRKNLVIPIEARICAVADAFVSLISPQINCNPWPLHVALQQVQSMAGVQLDPELVAVLMRATEVEDLVTSKAKRSDKRYTDDNQLSKSKRKLFEALELVY